MDWDEILYIHSSKMMNPSNTADPLIFWFLTLKFLDLGEMSWVLDVED